MVRPLCMFFGGLRLPHRSGWVEVYDLKYWRYNPDWRKEINKDDPPSAIVLAPGVQDAEFD